ncbi:MAG: hypothetical protein Hyperionvirus7_40 [Hyperionvirus sp.]|uniref:Uncharacterized protein n=1 Tax=Hyperionvirus sp. TaxID=2487770 RepID=A0A3G5ADM2_9VIRU|nr:MAG: hypothetical protein Hyperionvirus7_40 [Hyperionvirus sp.]
MADLKMTPRQIAEMNELLDSMGLLGEEFPNRVEMELVPMPASPAAVKRSVVKGTVCPWFEKLKKTIIG